MSLADAIDSFYPLTLLKPSAIKHATAAGLEKIGAELAKLVSTSTERGVHYYNKNYERIGKWQSLSLQTFTDILHRMADERHRKKVQEYANGGR